jgi:hypothetical protein
VALTRTTRYLDVVCVGAPLPLEAPTTPLPRVPQQRLPDDATVDLAQLAGVAAQVAALVGGSAPAPLWNEVILRAAAILDRDSGGVAASGRHRRD